MTQDQSSYFAAAMDRLDAIRFLRRLGLTYRTAARTRDEIERREPQAVRAIIRGWRTVPRWDRRNYPLPHDINPARK